MLHIAWQGEAPRPSFRRHKRRFGEICIAAPRPLARSRTVALRHLTAAAAKHELSDRLKCASTDDRRRNEPGNARCGRDHDDNDELTDAGIDRTSPVATISAMTPGIRTRPRNFRISSGADGSHGQHSEPCGGYGDGLVLVELLNLTFERELATGGTQMSNSKAPLDS